MIRRPVILIRFEVPLSGARNVFRAGGGGGYICAGFPVSPGCFLGTVAIVQVSRALHIERDAGTLKSAL